MSGMRDISIQEAIAVETQLKDFQQSRINQQETLDERLRIDVMDSQFVDEMGFDEMASVGMLKPPFRLPIVAQSGSGKTNLILNLLSDRMYGAYFTKFYVMSNSLGLDKMWENLTDEQLENCWDHYDEKELQKIFDDQKELVENKFGGRKTRENALLVVLDDVIEDLFHHGASPQKVMDNLSMRGRHANISFIIVSQQYKLIPKTLRVNCNALMLFQVYNLQEREDIMKEHGGQFEKKQMKQLLRYIWNLPYQFLFIDYSRPNVTRFRKNLDRVILDETIRDQMFSDVDALTCAR